MAKFELVPLSEIKGKIAFFKLQIDSICQFDAFCREIEADGNLKKQLRTGFARMEQVANMQRLPLEKFRDITPSKELVREFEIKTPDLRFYLIKYRGHVIVIGGKKNSQKEDIRKFRLIKKRYLESNY